VRSVSGRPEGPSYCSSLSVILIKSDLAWLMVPQDKPDGSDYLIHTNVTVWYFDDPNICVWVRACAGYIHCRRNMPVVSFTATS